MDLVKAYNFLSEERITMIKSLSFAEEQLGKKERELKKLKKNKAPYYEIESCERIIENYKDYNNNLRKLLDVYFEAAESIKAMIALKNHLKTKGCDLYWELEGILSPVLKEWIYGKE
jgi:hypothetical protein